MGAPFQAGTPTVLGLRIPGNIDLFNRPQVRNPSGEISTVRSISVGTDRGTVLIPTVVGNRVVSNQEAIDHFKRTGQHLGIFDTHEHADAYSRALHTQQDAPIPGSGRQHRF
jgi:hypothetical protein